MKKEFFSRSIFSTAVLIASVVTVTDVYADELTDGTVTWSRNDS